MLTKTAMMLAATALAFGASTVAASARDYDDCHDRNATTGTILGAVAGGIIGNQFGHGGGKAAATVGGVVLGGMAGNAIARDMDCGDRPYAFHAYNEGFHGPLHRSYYWHHGYDHGYMMPVREYWRDDDEVCRDFRVTTFHDGEAYTRYGTACRDGDDDEGDWHMM